MQASDKSVLWNEEYRPHKIADCILPPRLKDYFQAMVSKGQLQNMTLVGPPGTGKTTVARALCEELGIDYLLINASENGNIDTIRTTVRNFASALSLDGGFRCIILDEADYLSSASQPALRGIIEEFAGNCVFIFTANFANRIIDPLYSRAPRVDFNFTKEEKKTLIIAFDKRVKVVLAEKNVEFDKQELAGLVVKNFPDFRKTLNLLQRFSQSGTLNVTSDTGLNDDQIKQLVGFLKEKDFTNMRAWVAQNMDNDGAMIRRALFDKSNLILEQASIPQLVLHISTYDQRESQVVDKEINMTAFLVECMADLKFR